MPLTALKTTLAWSRRGLMWVAQRVPLIQALTSFSADQHKEASKKFFSLWLLSLLPGVFSFYLLSANQPKTILGQFAAAFTPAEQFVYAVSFLSPVLYLVWERHEQKRKYIAAGKRSPGVLAVVPRGFGVIVLLALVVFAFTAFAFGAAKAWEQSPIGSFQHSAAVVAVQSAIWVYVYGVFCWYLTILMSVEAEWIDYAEQTREQEKAVEAGLNERLASKGGADAG